MPRAKLTISALRNLLADRETELAKLVERRSRLLTRLNKIDRRIATLSGEKAPAPAGAAKGGLPRIRRTRAGRVTLRAAVRQVLSGSKSGMKADEIFERLPGTGYSSSSKNVGNMMRQILYKCPDFRRVSRGMYKLSKSAARQ